LPADYIHLAHCLVAAHDMEGAQRALEEAIRTEPDNWDGYLQLADLLQMMGAQAKAEEKYREAAQHSGASPVPGNALGLFLLNGNRAGDARPVLEKALSLAPEVVETRLNLALCLGNMGQIMEAEQLAREVLTTTPSDSQNHQNAARLLQSISNPPKSNA
jgi:Tfp pilus assembly protein PilF